MSRLAIASKLIHDHEYDLAMDFLGKDVEDKKALYLLSLLNRYFDRYSNEVEVVQKALTLDPSCSYMKKRLAWLQLSTFEQLVPRQPFHMPKDPFMTPRDETLKQLCIITGGDSNVFEMLVQCLESIRATRQYQDVALIVFDVGLSDKEKNYIAERIKGVRIMDPGWHIPLEVYESETAQKHKFLASRCYLDKILPDYRYYLTIDADAWVHDERALDHYVCLAERQGIAIAKNPCVQCDKFKDSHWYKADKRLPKEDEEAIAEKTMYNAGIFCVDKETGFFKNWSSYFEKIVAYFNKMRHGVSESSIVYVLHQKHAQHTHECLGHWCNFSFEREGAPIVHDNTNVLYVPHTNQPVGIVHLLASIKHVQQHYFFPTQKRKIPLQRNEFEEHWKAFWQILQTCRQKNVLPMQFKVPNHQLISMHYRVLPWEDKPQLRETILREASCLV